MRTRGGAPDRRARQDRTGTLDERTGQRAKKEKHHLARSLHMGCLLACLLQEIAWFLMLATSSAATSIPVDQLLFLFIFSAKGRERGGEEKGKERSKSVYRLYWVPAHDNW